MSVERIVLVMSRGLVVLLISLLAGVRPGSAAADLGTSFRFEIPPQKLPSALLRYSQQSGVQVTSAGDLIEGRNSPGVVGMFDARDALQRLLSGTDLSYEVIGHNTVVITSNSAPRQNTGATGEAQRSSPERFRLAQGNQTAAAVPAEVEEIVVTAQKREERLEDVPVPVTAINSDALANTNKLRLQDYYTQVPGLSVTPSDRGGAPQVTIRGITTGGYTNPTVGITVDDVPFGSSTNLAVGSLAPDIDPSELARVEVLRGPQGTLYGASSLGGLIKYVTVDPSTDVVSGRIQGGASAVHHGDDAGYNLRGAVNVPLGDQFAVRGSGYVRRNPGYIDNIQTGQRGVNQQGDGGGRLSALWRASGTFSVKLSALYERSAEYGSPFVDVKPEFADLQQSMLPQTGRSASQIQAYSATVRAKIGEMDLTAITGYNIFKFNDSPDVTPLLGPATALFFGGLTGTPLHENFRTSKFTEELRLSARAGDLLDWLVGGFYTHESSNNIQDILAADPAGAIVGSWDHGDFPSSYTEFATFADLTFHFTSRFDLQLGGRESRNRQAYMETYSGIYTLFLGGDGVTPLVHPETHTQDSSFTYLVTPQFRVTDNLMVYARLASGYRPGGPNVSAGVAGLPTAYKADTTRNYELGLKGHLLEHVLTYDVSAYYIDWRNIQLQLYNPSGTIAYEVNGSQAKSQGLELAVQAHPLRGLQLGTSLSYNDAVLTEALPPGGPGSVVGARGDRLPYSSRFSGNVSVQQDFPLWGAASGFVGARVSYVGDRQGIFRPGTPRQVFPSYVQTDMSAGAHYGPWSLDLYANNVTDRRGVLSGGVGTLIPYQFIYIQPLTFGLLLSRTL